MRLLATHLARMPIAPRTPSPLLFDSSVDGISTLTAVGLQGFIQSTREATAFAFNSVQSVALPTIAGAILYIAIGAWREGKAFRLKSATPMLTSRDLSLLMLCVILDLVSAFGNTPFFAGEASDLLWAPVGASLLYNLFESPALSGLQLVKELLPFTDIVPVATVAWLCVYAYPESRVARTLGVKRPAVLWRDDGNDY